MDPEAEALQSGLLTSSIICCICPIEAVWCELDASVTSGETRSIECRFMFLRMGTMNDSTHADDATLYRQRYHFVATHARMDYSKSRDLTIPPGQSWNPLGL